ncbi:MAG: hypothetical protein Q4G69_02050 [Planctomycetia bacterium]|nr:hypothetical protein [Planctomycetia bacterium]
MKKLIWTFLLIVGLTGFSYAADVPSAKTKNTAPVQKKEKATPEKKAPEKSAPKAKPTQKQKAPVVQADPLDWLKKDDIVIVHSPSNCRTLESFSSLSGTSEWVGFLDPFCDKIEAAYENAIQKSEAANKIDAWIRNKVPNAFKNGKLDPRKIIDAYYDHVLLVVLSLDVDLQKTKEDRFNGTFSFLLNEDPFADPDIEQFLLKDLGGKKISDKKGALIVKFQSPKGDFYWGRCSAAKKGNFLIVCGKDQKSVEDRLLLERTSGNLSQLITAKNEMINMVYFNLTFFKKVVEKAGKNIPYFPNKDMFDNIVSRVEMIVYSVEKKENGGVSVSFKIKSDSEESGKELNDLALGMIALYKIQGNRKNQDKEITQKEKVLYETAKIVEVNRDQENVELKLNLSKEKVISAIKQGLGVLKKKMVF